MERELAGPVPKLSISRREFLAATGSGIFLFFTVGELPAEGQARRPGVATPSDFNAYLRIGADGRVACYTGKIEMGQGIVTSLAQMLADELDVPLTSVDMVMGDTDLCPYDRGTFGSMSTRFFGPPLRAAGAEARQVLLELAAERLRVSAGELGTEAGTVFETKAPGRRIGYGELVQGRRIERHASGAAVKAPAAFAVMGRPATRRDAEEKVTGRARYAADIRVPGMVYAKVLRPPSHGARLLRVDVTAAERVPGARVVRQGELIAVLHEHPDVAELALAKIRAEYDRPALAVDDATIFDHLLKAAPEGSVLAAEGDLEAGERGALAVVEATYLNDYVAHAPIEPHAALVRLEGGRATVWASTQAPFGAREEVAAALGLPSESVHVIAPFVGGGFGGKTRHLQVVEAARLAKLSGKPVMVAWTREEEFFHDSFRPAAVVKIKAGLGAPGRIGFWDYRVYFAGERGAAQFYQIPHHRTQTHGSLWGGGGPHPFATGAWRAPGNNTNTFARESHIDLLAARAGLDPLEFRLQNLTDPRMRRVLTAAADKFGWTAAPAPSGRGRGIACAMDAGTYVATIAEAKVDTGTGEIHVTRVVSAQDMGWAINPEGAAIQMEGCITMGLGYALKEGLRFKGGEILDRSFGTYQIPRFSWLPAIETVLLDDKHLDPGGGGEPAIVTMGAVAANAVHDATGVRLLHLPMTPSRVRAAMQAAK